MLPQAADSSKIQARLKQDSDKIGNSDKMRARFRQDTMRDPMQYSIQDSFRNAKTYIPRFTASLAWLRNRDEMNNFQVTQIINDMR